MFDLSSGGRSGLIETPGKVESFLLLAKTETASFDRFMVTRIGIFLSLEYFPNLKQSRTEYSMVTDKRIEAVASISCEVRI